MSGKEVEVSAEYFKGKGERNRRSHPRRSSSRSTCTATSTSTSTSTNPPTDRLLYCIISYHIISLVSSVSKYWLIHIVPRPPGQRTKPTQINQSELPGSSLGTYIPIPPIPPPHHLELMLNLMLNLRPPPSHHFSSLSFSFPWHRR